MKLIHIASIEEQAKGKVYLFLREKNSNHYVWLKEEQPGQEVETSVSAPTSEEALRLARREWWNSYFRPLNCGFRYTLPERDEHGYNALFHQMVASYTSFNGIYFDAELGNNCIIHNASLEARTLWKQLQQASRI